MSKAFQSRLRVRTFDIARKNWMEAVRAFRPQAIAGTFAQMESLTRIGTLTHAIVILSTEAGPRLTSEQRDFLWRTFRVPAFEQIVAPDGTLLAAECEAHDGLHIVSPLLTAPAADIDQSPCPCGRPGTRLIRPELRSRAVTANQPI